MEPQERIFYGSIDPAKARKAPAPAPSGPARKGDTLEFSAITANAIAKHRQEIEAMDAKKKARVVAIPTNDATVKLKLRELGEPIILFGEKPEDRRSRLRDLIMQLGLEDAMPAGENGAEEEEKEEKPEAFLTEGTPALKDARLWIADYSLKRARERIAKAKAKREEYISTPSLVDDTRRHLGEMHASLKRISNTSSQVGDERPLSSVCYSPDSSCITSASWTGTCKVWDAQDSTLKAYVKGHRERVTSVAFHPQAMIGLSPDAVNLATSSADGSVRLWSGVSASRSDSMDTTDSRAPSTLTPLALLEGHTDRINKVVFHPSGRYVASASADSTWRLWDIETATNTMTGTTPEGEAQEVPRIPCLFDQEGHRGGVFAVSFQSDGSLVASGGEDAGIRIWDMRSGRNILTFAGHVKQVICLDWSPNGYIVASGSDDHTVRLWDLRGKACAGVLPAHSSLISAVRFSKTAGEFLVTASYDHHIKIWNTRDWAPIKTLVGHEAKVMDVDVSHDNKTIVSASYDKTWKLWANDPLV
eukprot:TRINITY_DN1519_c1_g1_i2.p1 TRINITY_DN1519_c1_g1~~TRINITY_DN1519_c1_g1_i2.p1  ORF type:complete len:532 (-),score=166.09 TRINITY_DN1519_c1_g1_i2:45-1640(-)